MRDPKSIWERARRGADDSDLRAEVERGRLRAEFQALQIALGILEEHREGFAALRAALARVESYQGELEALRSSNDALRAEIAGLRADAAQPRAAPELEALRRELTELRAEIGRPRRVEKQISYDAEDRISRIIEERE